MKPGLSLSLAIHPQYQGQLPAKNTNVSVHYGKEATFLHEIKIIGLNCRAIMDFGSKRFDWQG
jgi:hypothetical protein